MTYYTEKQISDIILKAREAIKTFPEKQNSTHKEILELMEDYDRQQEWDKEAKEKNKILKAKYKEIEPLIDEVNQAAEVLRKAQYKLGDFIKGLFKERIAEEWKYEKGRIESYKAKDYDEQPISEYSDIYKLIKQQERLERADARIQASEIKTLLKDGWDKETWLESVGNDEKERNIAGKLETRLKKLEKKTPTEQFYSIKDNHGTKL